MGNTTDQTMLEVAGWNYTVGMEQPEPVARGHCVRRYGFVRNRTMQRWLKQEAPSSVSRGSLRQLNKEKEGSYGTH